MYFAHGIREMKQKMKSRGSIHALVNSLSFSLLVCVCMCWALARRLWLQKIVIATIIIASLYKLKSKTMINCLFC